MCGDFLSRGKLTFATLVALSLANADVFAGPSYLQTNLVSDGFVPATFTDPNLKNPWGVSVSPTGPFWVSDQFTGKSTLYTGTGEPQGLVVTIPQPAPPSPKGPTGQIFNTTNDFNAPGTGSKSLFVFASLDGGISAWNPTAGTTAVQAVPSQAGRIYTGLALGSSGGDNRLYAADNAGGKIDVYDKNFAPTTTSGNFVDPTIPAGYHPFNVQNVDGKIYITYSTGGGDADEEPLGSGFVSEFDTDGNFIRRFASGGNLASPWGMTKAPADFGDFSGDILVGNFSEDHGIINAFDPITGDFDGTLTDKNGHQINNPYLWALIFGNGGQAGQTNELFFSAGVGDEEHGLFGKVTVDNSPSAVPLPAAAWMMPAGLAMVGWVSRRQLRQAIAR